MLEKDDLDGVFFLLPSELPPPTLLKLDLLVSRGGVPLGAITAPRLLNEDGSIIGTFTIFLEVE